MNLPQELLVMIDMLQHIDQHHRITRERPGNNLQTPIDKPHLRILRKLFPQDGEKILGRLDEGKGCNLRQAQEAMRERSNSGPHLYDMATKC